MHGHSPSDGTTLRRPRENSSPIQPSEGTNGFSTDLASSRVPIKQFENQALKFPKSPALIHAGEQLSYEELNQRANLVARNLRKNGVGPESVVGVCLERSVGLIAGLLGIWKSGGAFCFMRPDISSDRSDALIKNCEVRVLLTQRKLAGRWAKKVLQIVCLEDLETEAEAGNENHSLVGAENLAFVTAQSNSSDRFKGIMFTHGNVLGLFARMDEALGREPGAWLSGRELSSDISVAELLWPLTRGYKVVLGPVDATPISERTVAKRVAERKMDFSLFYFACEEGDKSENKYRLLIEGAQFADQNGFTAVWTPERHFHAFGGLYPNPAVTSAALAMITKRLQIRAGSVVLPLHNPLRVAEEWSVVDNLSNGRAAISFASGWHANDFVFAPEKFPDRRKVMCQQIETVRKLWSGESIKCNNGEGAEIEVKIFPRPIQSQLPMWITASGNSETFRLAGEMGVNVLTHLLGQTVEELAAKIAVYRQAWRAADHTAVPGHVTLMLHTFVGEDLTSVRDTVRKPFIEYLKTSTDLFRKARSERSSGIQNSKRDSHEPHENDMNAVMDYAFERYFRESGLFGTPDLCGEMVDRLKEIGVDEVACLIDFGVEPELVLRHLEFLDELKARANQVQNSNAVNRSLPAIIREHKITHLQISPASIKSIERDSSGCENFNSVRHLVLEGEPGFQILADPSAEKSPVQIHNFTAGVEFCVDANNPLEGDKNIFFSSGCFGADTHVHILDDNLTVTPNGGVGRLFVSGASIARGFMNDAGLTAEKFVPDPFGNETGARLFKTGYRAQRLENGNFELVGKVQNRDRLAASLTPTEARLAEIWRAIFGRDVISVHDNFFELGGQSLHATQVMLRVRESFRLELPISLLFNAPTIAAFAALIDAGFV